MYWVHVNEIHDHDIPNADSNVAHVFINLSYIYLIKFSPLCFSRCHPGYLSVPDFCWEMPVGVSPSVSLEAAPLIMKFITVLSYNVCT